MSDLDGLPGAGRIERGIHDLETGRLSTNALLVSIAASRLSDLGLSVPEGGALPGDPDLALYESLRDHPTGDPYFRYNVLRRELDRFISCLEARRMRPASPDQGVVDDQALVSPDSKPSAKIDPRQFRR